MKILYNSEGKPYRKPIIVDVIFDESIGFYYVYSTELELESYSDSIENAISEFVSDFDDILHIIHKLGTTSFTNPKLMGEYLTYEPL